MRRCAARLAWHGRDFSVDRRDLANWLQRAAMIEPVDAFPCLQGTVAQRGSRGPSGGSGRFHAEGARLRIRVNGLQWPPLQERRSQIPGDPSEQTATDP